MSDVCKEYKPLLLHLPHSLALMFYFLCGICTADTTWPSTKVAVVLTSRSQTKKSHRRTLGMYVHLNVKGVRTRSELYGTIHINSGFSAVVLAVRNIPIILVSTL